MWLAHFTRKYNLEEAKIFCLPPYHGKQAADGVMGSCRLNRCRTRSSPPVHLVCSHAIARSGGQTEHYKLKDVADIDGLCKLFSENYLDGLKNQACFVFIKDRIPGYDWLLHERYMELKGIKVRDSHSAGFWFKFVS
jgi:hypothetical protein